MPNKHLPSECQVLLWNTEICFQTCHKIWLQSKRRAFWPSNEFLCSAGDNVLWWLEFLSCHQPCDLFSKAINEPWDSGLHDVQIEGGRVGSTCCHKCLLRFYALRTVISEGFIGEINSGTFHTDDFFTVCDQQARPLKEQKLNC